MTAELNGDFNPDVNALRGAVTALALSSDLAVRDAAFSKAAAAVEELANSLPISAAKRLSILPLSRLITKLPSVHAWYKNQ